MKISKRRNDVIVPLSTKREYSKLTYAKVDADIAPLVALLNILGTETKGACSGHGKYKPSIIINVDGENVEFFSNKIILRKRNFYRLDKSKEKFYFVPELEKPNVI